MNAEVGLKILENLKAGHCNKSLGTTAPKVKLYYTENILPSFCMYTPLNINIIKYVQKKLNKLLHSCICEKFSKPNPAW